MYNMPNENLLSATYYTYISNRLLPIFVFVSSINKIKHFWVVLTKMNELSEL